MEAQKTKSLARYSLASLFMLLALSTNSTAQQASNGNEAIAFQGSVAATINGKNQQWFHYQVEMEPNNGMPCCLINKFESSCDLDNRSTSWSSSDQSENDSTILNLYFKTGKKQVTDLLMAGGECTVNTGDHPLISIKTMTAQASIDFLKPMLGASSKLSHTALAAIAFHQGEEAQALLLNLIEQDTGKLRNEAIFWLGQARNTAGYQALVNIVDDASQSDKTRQQAIFALSENNDPRAPDKLIDLAKIANHTSLQAESIFWLAQNHPTKAGVVINHILAKSSDTQLRKKAIFSLAQIDTEQSWQQLLDLAKNARDRVIQGEAIFWLSQNDTKNPVNTLLDLIENNNPEPIKKKAIFSLAQLEMSLSTQALKDLATNSKQKWVQREAIFWLGQSKDPKALNYIEQMLSSN